ncbi:sigma-70 family RNA polymerase sigma factor [Chryseobacterium herbae]|uniref:Sigma-70 family RNA polymerase sigma factor n=1 Tax=Chryseobacterium herbae TaxID=2976476 RepID=A0ABT2ISQ9_9FLAO|nr:sigma-70 family RNA polymerase sigma factor [Chryseobacterium sp. pc1-10]
MKFFSRHISIEEDRYKDLFYSYYYRVYLHTARRVSGKENVRDIAQNVFVHLWKYRKDLMLQNPEAIIFNSCNQEISKFLKGVEKQPLSSSTTETDYADDSDEQLIFKLKKENRLVELEKSIELIIPPLRRKIFKMNKLEGVTQQQIAVLLDIPKSTVKRHIAEAMMFLKNHYKNLK